MDFLYLLLVAESLKWFSSVLITVHKIYASQPISNGATLVSSKGNFKLGFFNPGISKDKYWGIEASQVQKQRWVLHFGLPRSSNPRWGDVQVVWFRRVRYGPKATIMCWATNVVPPKWRFVKVARAHTGIPPAFPRVPTTILTSSTNPRFAKLSIGVTLGKSCWGRSTPSKATPMLCDHRWPHNPSNGWIGLDWKWSDPNKLTYRFWPIIIQCKFSDSYPTWPILLKHFHI